MRPSLVLAAGDGAQASHPLLTIPTLPELMRCPLACLPAGPQQAFAMQLYQLAYERAVQMTQRTIYDIAYAPSAN